MELPWLAKELAQACGWGRKDCPSGIPNHIASDKRRDSEKSKSVRSRKRNQAMQTKQLAWGSSTPRERWNSSC
jgi:hypothetical protein